MTARCLCGSAASIECLFFCPHSNNPPIDRKTHNEKKGISTKCRPIKIGFGIGDPPLRGVLSCAPPPEARRPFEKYPCNAQNTAADHTPTSLRQARIKGELKGNQPAGHFFSLCAATKSTRRHASREKERKIFFFFSQDGNGGIRLHISLSLGPGAKKRRPR